MEDAWATLAYKHSSERLGPVLVSFPRSPPPPYLFDPSHPSHVDFRLFSNKSERKTHQQSFFGENEKWAYKGINYGKFSENSRGARYALGLYDRNKSMVTLTDFEGVFSMEPVLKQDLLKPIQDTRTATNEELRGQLIESFGTKKSKQRYKSAKGREIDGSAIAGTEKIAKNIKTKAEAENRPTDEMVESQRDHLPPFHIEATEQADIYPLSQLLSPELMEELDIKTVLKCYKKPKFIKKLIGSWEKFSVGLLDNLSPDEPEKLKAAAYLNALLRFYKKPRILTIKSDQWPDFLSSTVSSESIAQHILQHFYQENKSKNGTKFQRTKTQTDKLISYILVLVLSCCDFVVDPTKLAEVLKLAQNKVITYLRSVGCRPTANNTYTLRAPLTFPTTVRRRR